VASTDDVLFDARARVLEDLTTTGCADPATVSAVEEAVSTRRWWAEQWPEGLRYVAGLIAQDVQDHLLGDRGRWPLCPVCEGATHALYIHPELGGPDPVWRCEESGLDVAPLGRLTAGGGSAPA
jgi:hypothetical protein